VGNAIQRKQECSFEGAKPSSGDSRKEKHNTNIIKRPD
jgi:hypothetical protein